jgi:Spy/CpxP family protein refolding chaperone
MTSRCERTGINGATCRRSIWLALLAAVTFGSVSPVMAQDDGTQLPAPPKLKRHQPDAPDADFQSPMKREPLQSDGDGQSGNGQSGFNAGRPGGRFAGQGGAPGAAGFSSQGFAAQVAARRRMQLGIPGARKPLDLTSLNLSEEQKQRIRDIRKASRQDIKTARRNIVQKQLELRKLLFSADANDADVRAARKQLRAAQNRMDDLGIDDLLQIRSVFTADQRQKFPDLAPPLPQPGSAGLAGRRTIGAGKN